MPTILAIDAAWTVPQPSGVALLQQVADRWRCIAVAPSYADFGRLARGLAVDWSSPTILVTAPGASALLDAALRLAGTGVNLVVPDMPLCTTPITGRRFANAAVSRAFGGRGCSTHSPSTVRPWCPWGLSPGGVRRAGLTPSRCDDAGGLAAAHRRGVSHPALLALLSVERRVPCKLPKATRYWPEATAVQRRARLVGEWRNVATSELPGCAQLRFERLGETTTDVPRANGRAKIRSELFGQNGKIRRESR